MERRPLDIPQLQTAECFYWRYEEFKFSELHIHLMPVLQPSCDTTFETSEFFHGEWWSRITSLHWEVPIAATVVYMLMMFVLKSYMKNRKPMRLTPLVCTWNFGLSIFSFCGMCYCLPALLHGRRKGLVTAGFYDSVCGHAYDYGNGTVGMFVALFIYSKVFELVDTLWLLLRKTHVIFLHWYHHVTVLLYCWHAYSSRIGTGLYFATMNYSVHSIMYFYYGLTQCGGTGRLIAKQFAIVITTMQLLQMVIGILVTVASVFYHLQGNICFVSLYNSFLGLLMYLSYFILFIQLFLQHYVYKKTVKPLSESSSKGEVDSLNAAADVTNMTQACSRTKQM
mmetsp:Transcript_76563/g.127637  ORF Transcript_76563/g.127637 Transcript_76563/m.127637 type:complete len:338 (+) Transcript_76563:36-1049(+)